MTQQLEEVQEATRASSRHQSIAVRRIRFVSEPRPAAKVVWTFQKPRACVATEEAVAFTDLRADNPEEEAADYFTFVLLPTDGVSAPKKIVQSWIAPSDHPDAVPTTSFSSNNCKIQWRPGKAMVQGPPEAFERVVEALVEFSFLEGELRRLERSLEKQEAVAPADVPRAHRIRFRDRKEWRRIGETVELVYRMRMTYGRLEAQFATAPHALPRDSRQVMERLIEETVIAERLEGFSNRLEACEDLYEGANDRIADYHWYLEGGWMELSIIGLLVIEIVLMGMDVYLKHAK